MPWSSTTRQAGESTRRVVTRTSLARSFSASFSFQHRLEGFGGFLGRLLLGLVLQLAQVHRALGHALQRRAVELVRWLSIHSSTRSVISSTSMPFLRKTSSCGLFLAAASVSAVM
jgi:hypothetical protein